MAKFCSQCGTQNQDEALNCASCGAPLEAPAAEQAQYNNTYAAPENMAQPEQAPAKNGFDAVMEKVDGFLAKIKLDRIKALIILGAVVGVILIAIIVSSIFFSPAATVRQFCDGIKNGNAEAVVNCFPSYMWEDDEDKKEDMIDSLDDSFDELKSFSYEIKKTYNLDEDERDDAEDFMDLYEDRYDDFDADDVSDFKYVKVKFTAKNEDGDKDSGTTKMLLIKYKGAWKIVYMTNSMF